MIKAYYVTVNKSFTLFVESYNYTVVDEKYKNEVEWKMWDGKNEISIGKGPSLNYKFNKSYAGKKIYITAYITSTQSAFELPFPEQTTMCSVENAVEQKALVRGVKGHQSANIGDEVEFEVTQYNIETKKVYESTKKAVKWEIQIDGENNALTIDGDFVKGEKIKFKVPESWNGKEVTLMPFVEQFSKKYSVVIQIKRADPTCGGTWVKPIRDGKYEVVNVFLGRDKSNRIFYVDEKTGEIITIGYSATPYSFYNDDDEAHVAVKAIIDTRDESGRKFLNMAIIGFGEDKKTGKKGISRPVGFWYYVFNASGGEKYDFKATNGTDIVIYEDHEIVERYRGMPINVKPQMDKPVYCSARDIGNIAAGIVAGMYGLSWAEGRIGFDGLESKQKKRLAVEAKSTQYAQRFGYNFGYNVIWMKKQSAKLSRLPSYGEVSPDRINEEVRILREGDLK